MEVILIENANKIDKYFCKKCNSRIVYKHGDIFIQLTVRC